VKKKPIQEEIEKFRTKKFNLDKMENLNQLNRIIRGL